MNMNMNNEARVRPTAQTTVNLEAPLYCPHDLTHNQDFRDNLPTLLNHPQLDINSNLSLQESQPTLPIFMDEDVSTVSKVRENLESQGNSFAWTRMGILIKKT